MYCSEASFEIEYGKRGSTREDGVTTPDRPSYTAPDDRYTSRGTGQCSRNVNTATVFNRRSRSGSRADAAGSPFAARYSAASTRPELSAVARSADTSEALVRSQRTART